MTDIPALIAGLKALRENPSQDLSDRIELHEAIRDACRAIETPVETVRRLGAAPIQLSIAKTAVDMKLFDIISKQQQPITLAELCAETGAQDLLLRRILRFLAAYGLIKQSSPDTYVASPATHTLAKPGFQAGIRNYHDVHLRTVAAVPRFLETNGYKNPTDAANAPFQLGHNTQLPAWAHAVQNPTSFRDFNEWMKVQREGEKTWLDVFPHDLLLAQGSSISAERPVFVDIGGGLGHQCVLLKQQLPQLQRPIILQDLQVAIARTIPIPGVQATVHDFWLEQPVKGASFYYMRNVLHDHPDAKCVELLRLTTDAMAADSAILVDEMVLPEIGCHSSAADLDIIMMSGLAAMERTERQWHDLFKQAGLVLKKRYTYIESTCQSLLMVVKRK